MRYVDEKQPWNDEKDRFWGGPEGAETFVAKLVADESLAWKVDDHMRYLTAVIGTDPLTNVAITILGKFNANSDMWVSTLKHTSPAVRLNEKALAEDLTDRLLERQRTVIAERETELRKSVDSYIEE